jgi:hypothetical protein
MIKSTYGKSIRSNGVVAKLRNFTTTVRQYEEV